MNNKEVIKEEIKSTDVKFNKKQRFLKWQKKQEVIKEDLKKKGIAADQWYMNSTAVQ